MRKLLEESTEYIGKEHPLQACLGGWLSNVKEALAPPAGEPVEEVG